MNNPEPKKDCAYYENELREIQQNRDSELGEYMRLNGASEDEITKAINEAHTEDYLQALFIDQNPPSN